MNTKTVVKLHEWTSRVSVCVAVMSFLLSCYFLIDAVFWNGSYWVTAGLFVGALISIAFAKREFEKRDEALLRHYEAVTLAGAE